METNEIRVQKYVADCGLMSRRKAEEEIQVGRIRVNGERVEQGRKIIPGVDRVEYLGKPVEMPRVKRFVYIMLNKPRGYVTTLSDEKERKCVAELVKDVGTRVYPVGRLDMDSEGLLLFTNDGDLANKLTHPKHRIPKIYHVKIKGNVTPSQFKNLQKPMVIDEYEIQPVACEIVARKEKYTTIRMELYEGRNRQIRKMCEQNELEISRLQRVAIGDITLEDLPNGKWKYLTREQVEYLKNS